MFTGIITDIGEIISLERIQGDMLRAHIKAQAPARDLALGDSIAHAGVCLTIVDLQVAGEAQLQWAVDISAETLSKTTLDGWRIGDKVNIEHALRMGDSLGGHLVSGHVDGLGKVTALRSEQGSYQIWIDAGPALARFIASKGSIAVDGISLTVNAVEGSCFSVNIIPHTWGHTTLSAVNIGHMVNLEIDMMARYMARYLDTAKDT